MTKIIKVDSDEVYVVEGPSLINRGETVKYGLLKKDLKKYIDRGQLTQVAQFYTLVNEGLILSKNCFRGLRRNLHCDNDSNGDSSKYALCRKPAYDYEWKGGKLGSPVKTPATKDRVFTVLISKNENHKYRFNEIFGWIDRWCWVEEDKGEKFTECPVHWPDRYEEKIW